MKERFLTVMNIERRDEIILAGESTSCRSLAPRRSEQRMKDEAMLCNEHCIGREVDVEIPLSMRQEM